MISFSIVVNTLNRGRSLGKTIDSFRWLKYGGNYEVIVVNGPSVDDTEEILEHWGGKLRVGKCDVANLSVSRNIGICMARGDVVAFIDDDAIPEPEWLTQLAAAYDSNEIGGAGGVVYDHTGYIHQYVYSTANRLGNANWDVGKPSEYLCFPGSFEFPYLQGTNASFRRSALLEVAGFDEEIEYYLDETELCCRLVDAGYVIRQLSNAYVHHKWAPSHLQDGQKISRYRYPVLKNKIYFSLKHARQYLTLTEILEDGQNFTRARANEVEFHGAGGQPLDIERQRFSDESDRAWERALQRGLSENRVMIDQAKIARHAGSFARFSPNVADNDRAIILVSRDFPPNHNGDVATFSKDLAEALAASGHIVQVITQSPDINRVDFENGVWVHRMVVVEMPRPPEAVGRKIPQHIWNWSATALAEARRISTHRSIDVVEAPIWDCEGIAFLLARQWPLITSLQTPLYFWLEFHPHFRMDTLWMETFGNPMLILEKELMLGSDSIRSISSAIKGDIERAYQFTFEEAKIFNAPIGISSRPARPYEKVSAQRLVMLFVGRLDHRNGIDILLNVIPGVLETFANVHFRIIGDDSLLGPAGKTYRGEFLGRYAGKKWIGNVTFEGCISEDALREAYACCDIFVSPSRLESFGLVFLEAMREGKPVIGCAAGGMSEIIADGINGILVQPNNEDALRNAVERLIRDESFRRRMGDKGRKIFEDNFTSELVAQRSAVLFDSAASFFSRAVLVKISYIVGVCVENDAISASVRDEIRWLKSCAGNDVRLYSYACTYDDLPFRKVSGLRDVAFDDHFQRSDLVVFHFGVFYELFDLLPVSAKGAKRVVVFHNVTPKQFVSVEYHATIDKSFRQMSNILFADRVICDSNTNLDVLRAAGIDSPAVVLPLAVHCNAQMPERKPSYIDGVVRISFVGRFVRSKGPEDLIEAFKTTLRCDQSMRLTLDLVGNLTFSDPLVLARINGSVAQIHGLYGERGRISIHGDATEVTKERILCDSDLFVLPSYHEGFCVPILEALASGAKVIAYENSNIPAISGGLARLVPTGDVTGLASAIGDAAMQIASPAWRGTGQGSYSEYAGEARDYVRQFRPENARRRFLEFIKFH